MSAVRDVIDAMKAEATRQGGRSIRVIRQRKHLAVVFIVDDPAGARTVTVGLRGRPFKSCRGYVASYESAVRHAAWRARGLAA